MYKDAKECFKALDKQGWNRGNTLKYNTIVGRIEYRLCDTEVCIYDIRWEGNENEDKLLNSIALPEIWYDKTPKNFCQCIAEIRVEGVLLNSSCTYITLGGERFNRTNQEALVEHLEKEIRHKLLCEEGDDWLEKINEFLK